MAEVDADRPNARRGSLISRAAFIALLLVVSGVGIVLFADFLWRTELYGLKYALLALHIVLFTFIAFGFCTALFGVFGAAGLRKKSRAREPAGGASAQDGDLPATAVVFPIYNEEIPRVFAGIEATYLSLERVGRQDSFDFFILSDTRVPDLWIEEEIAYFHIVKRLRALGRIHFRHRHANEGMKAGNIGDFLEKWGGHYRYMIVFDADSLMSGSAIVELVRRMEADPTLGIIQTIPGIVRAHTFYGRAQQFANRLYGRVFMAGMDAWQWDSGNYVGHNAIIRVRAFMENCRLPRLPWREPMGGQIFSHDFVEAALLARGGYSTVWACDIEESYEEGPANLLESAQRNRRWCQGNLQHAWLLFSRDLPLVNRCHFLLGIMAYTSSLLWLCFLVLSTLLVVQFEQSGLTLVSTASFIPHVQLPLKAEGALVFGLTLILLFAPKVFSFIDVCLDPGRRRRFGGGDAALAGIVMESVLSVVLAPILMLWNAVFVVTIPMGKGVKWSSQSRSQELGMTWGEAARAGWWQTAAGVAWTVVVVLFTNVTFLCWMSPILAPLVFSIPVNVLISSPGVGRKLRRARLLITPEENTPPRELIELAEAESRLTMSIAELRGDAATLVLVDPYINALHVTLQRQLRDGGGDAVRQAIDGEMLDRLLREGRESLTRDEFLALLGEPGLCHQAHHNLWRLLNGDLAAEWTRTMASYTPSRRIDLFDGETAANGV